MAAPPIEYNLDHKVEIPDDFKLRPSGYINGFAYTAILAEIPIVTDAIKFVCYTNIPLCLLVILVVALNFRQRHFGDRVSFRLSASIALSDIMYSVTQLILMDNKATDSMSAISLRFIFFFKILSLIAFTFSTICIAFHLNISAILNKTRIAQAVHPYYEVISWVAAILVTWPVLFMFKEFRKIPQARAIVMIDTSRIRLQIQVWSIFIYFVLGITYCTVVCCLVMWRLMPIWRRISKPITMPSDANTHTAVGLSGSTRISGCASGLDHQGDKWKSLNDPEPCAKSSYDAISQHMNSMSFTHYNGLENVDHDDDFQHCQPSKLYSTISQSHTKSSNNKRPAYVSSTQLIDSHMTIGSASSSGGGGGYNSSIRKKLKSRRPKISPVMSKRRREVRFAVIRISLYVFIPLITVTFVALHEIMAQPTAVLTDLAMIMPALNGIFNFAIFVINPALDATWNDIFSAKSYDKFEALYTAVFKRLKAKNTPTSNNNNNNNINKCGSDDNDKNKNYDRFGGHRSSSSNNGNDDDDDNNGGGKGFIEKNSPCTNKRRSSEKSKTIEFSASTKNCSSTIASRPVTPSPPLPPPTPGIPSNPNFDPLGISASRSLSASTSSSSSSTSTSTSTRNWKDTTIGYNVDSHVV
ncbi:hypothetical protein H4219_004406 [Mycoemilia scoparia]|uniref:Uncharacterized protein n=1 Tax=Mycoemilia scoparia TaxID=417184 RepID=A0A9W8DRX5_9FUNG|nr:hypothetical protein H4219_004406 [Mycoemilia scoparia]